MKGQMLDCFLIRNGSELTKLTKESIISRLKEKGFKITAQRRAIIEVLIAQRDLHPSARLVYKAAQKRKQRLSLSATYATLNELSRHGIVKLLQFDRMENRYDANLEHHINLVCERCKKILDYRISLGVDQKKAAKQTGFSITDTRLEYYGYCRECRKEKGSMEE
jgi:Fur family transcriptional regulator, peroxide stress response regulator